jgi:hypothetical protein
LGSTLGAAWNQAVRSGDVLYFFDISANLYRYDLSTESWLEPRPLSDVPTAGWIDGEMGYVAYGKSVSRFEIEGANETHLRNFTNAVHSLFVDENLLIVNFSSGSYGHFASLQKLSGTLLYEHEAYIESSFGSSILPDQNKIFGRNRGTSPSDIIVTTYTDSGEFISSVDSPHHGDFPGATRTWVFPNGARVVDDSGTVYSTGSLNYQGAFGESFVDVAFQGDDLPVFITENRVVGLNAALLPTGYIDLSFSPEEIQIHDDTVFLFSPDATQTNGIRIDQFDLADLSLPDPGEPIDPTTVMIDPDAIFVDRDGVINLFSRQLLSLFRWDSSTFSWIGTKPLPVDPKFVAYDEQHHQLFCASDSGLVTRLDLSEDLPRAIPFANLPTSPLGMTVAGDFLFTVDSSGAWETHRVFDLETGIETSSSDWSNTSQAYYWDETRRRVYYFRDDTSPNDIMYREISAAGVLGEQVDSTYHGDYQFTHPMRFFPDRSRILTGSGVIFNAGNLNYNSTLTNQIHDAAWLNDWLFTLRRNSSSWNSPAPTSTTLQKWGSATLFLEDDAVFGGTPEALFSIDGELIAVVSHEGALRFLAMNEDLEVLQVSSLGGGEGDPIQVKSENDGYQLSWDPDSFHPDDILIVETLQGDGNWSEMDTVTVAEGQYSLENLNPGSFYDFRFKLKERIATNPLTTELTMAHTYYLSWNAPSVSSVFTPYLRMDPDDEWQELAQINAASRSWTYVGLETFQKPEVELHYVAEQTSLVPEADVSTDVIVHFNWLRSPYDESGYKLGYINEQGKPVIVSSFGKNVFNVSFPLDDLVKDPSAYRIYVVRDESLFTHNLQTSIQMQLSWADALESPEHYRVEVNSYGSVWSSLSEPGAEVSSVSLKFVSTDSVPDLRVLRIEGTQVQVYANGLSEQIRTELSWPSGAFDDGTPALEWRESANGEWTLDSSYLSRYSTSASRTYAGGTAREYRLSLQQTIDSRVIGFATLQVPVEIDLSTYQIDHWNPETDSNGALYVEMRTELGLSYTLEESDDMENWSAASEPMSGSGRIENWEFPTPQSFPTFYRFRLEKSH